MLKIILIWKLVRKLVWKLIWKQALAKVKKLADFLVSLIFPKTCLICEQIIDSGYFCSSDFNKLEFLSKPACKICFYPFENNNSKDLLCLSCLKKKPSYFQALAVFRYNRTSKNLVSQLKYADKTHLAKCFAKIIYSNCQEILKNNIDFIAAVPLHKQRLRKRKYNQAALLGFYLSQLTKIKIISDLLVRTRNTAPQTSLNQKLRRKNIVNAFAVNDKYKEKVRGKVILLIDDVITTGATVE